jgi:NTP pyrophosphatase (non-canonical NTP hydrolase)
MNLQEYIPLANVTMPKGRTREENLSMLALGLCGEASEVSVAFDNNPEKDAIGKEIGDVMWYAANLIHGFLPTFIFKWKEEISIFGVVSLPENWQQPMLRALMEDTGIIAEHVKKHLYHGKPLSLPALDEQVGNVICGCIAAARYAKLDIEDILDTNIAKLKARYPEGFSIAASLNRPQN